MLTGEHFRTLKIAECVNREHSRTVRVGKNILEQIELRRTIENSLN